MRLKLLFLLIFFGRSLDVSNNTEQRVCAGDDIHPRHSYIQRFAGHAMFSQIKYGIPASVILAQGILESRRGTSKLFIVSNNHFGIKCFRSGCRHESCAIFNSDLPGEAFISFATHPECFDYHGKMLSSGRYKRLSGRSVSGWCDGLGVLGYSTGDNYAKILKQLISKYELGRYDTRAWVLFNQACRIR